MRLPKYSFGCGDRFGREGRAQLHAILDARSDGIDIVPVWNKSFREHQIIGSRPDDVRIEADQAVQSSGYAGPYFVDADHINLDTVEAFLDSSDFFTIDVAENIGKAPDSDRLAALINRRRDLVGSFSIDALDARLEISESQLKAVAESYLAAVQQAGRIYRAIAEKTTDCVIEVSMDETEEPQGPLELLVILAALADEGIPVQTVAPKFSGRFNKGIDYVGAVDQFEREFAADAAVVRFAIQRFGLPETLKLSVHSGSDKFSIYEPIRRVLQTSDAGLHLKTAGTTWLEELIGLAESEGPGLEMAKEIYGIAYDRREALCGPYASVIDIDPGALSTPKEVSRWNGLQYAAALRHDPKSNAYNPNLRQLLHVGYKIAAEMGERFLAALNDNRASIERNVRFNLLERHIRPVFGR